MSDKTSILDIISLINSNLPLLACIAGFFLWLFKKEVKESSSNFVTKEQVKEIIANEMMKGDRSSDYYNKEVIDKKVKSIEEEVSDLSRMFEANKVILEGVKDDVEKQGAKIDRIMEILLSTK